MHFLPTIAAVFIYWLIVGLGGSVLIQFTARHLFSSIFFFSALGSLLLLVTACLALGQTSSHMIIPLGIPGYPFYCHLDALASFFLILLSATSLGTSLFSMDYFQDLSRREMGLLSLQYHLFLCSMLWVFIAADAYSFMLAWELMTLSSYFLIVGFKSDMQTRSAGFLYLLIAHAGALAILMSFALLLPGEMHLNFAAMQHTAITPVTANLVFMLALAGFGAKAGLLPLHVWLPEAHPAAPSPISALMSGVMLTTAIYGLIRVLFYMLPSVRSGWGMTLLGIGLLSALFGVIFAAMQTDMKRLLAYSSMENMGIIIAGLGLTVIFRHYGSAIAALALAASLLHCINHAFYKSLLFLGTGNVLHATGERNLGKLGGLIKSMPWVATLMLIAVLATSGLPPFNGFVSEWLLLQTFLAFPSVPAVELASVLALATAAFILTLALTAYVMVKLYGVIFLGQPRESQLTHAVDATFWERAGLLWLTAGCILLGLLPGLLLQPLLHLTTQLLHLPASTMTLQARYNPLIVSMVMLIAAAIITLLVRLFSPVKPRRSAAWNCAYPVKNARMQDTAEGFSQPIRHIFSLFLRIQTEIPGVADKMPHYHFNAEDRFWSALYLPLVRIASKCATAISKLQQGKISIYLTYSLATLIILLWWVL